MLTDCGRSIRVICVSYSLSTVFDTLLKHINRVYLKVISGEVGTNILKNDALRKLPEGHLIHSSHKIKITTKKGLDSYYSPLAAEFQTHVQRTVKSMMDQIIYC